MLIFTLLVSGVFNAASIPTVEVDLTPNSEPSPAKQFYQRQFEHSPDTRSFMVIIPEPKKTFTRQSRSAPKWLEPNGGWVSRKDMNRPFAIRPLREGHVKPAKTSEK
ncbi:hypothetical protein [Candidatus Phycosocius spiralis]|nr:hypothetical protein [Candidatus Phycosocius spiralis]